MLREVDGGVEVTVWVVPGASRTDVVGPHGDALKVRVAEPAEGGRATAAVLDLLASLTGHRASLTAGATSRRKRVLLSDASLQDARRALDPG